MHSWTKLRHAWKELINILETDNVWLIDRELKVLIGGEKNTFRVHLLWENMQWLWMKVEKWTDSVWETWKEGMMLTKESGFYTIKGLICAENSKAEWNQHVVNFFSHYSDLIENMVLCWTRAGFCCWKRGMGLINSCWCSNSTYRTTTNTTHIKRNWEKSKKNKKP